MSPTRRDFIKYVVVGSVAAGCPIDATLLASAGSLESASKVEGEHFEVCHQIRNGHQFARPAASKRVGIVIVGGGVGGLSAAYFLRGEEWLLLEKEDHFGGNAYQEEFEGQAFATGSAYAYKGDHGDQLANELGLSLPFVNNPDPTIVNRTFVADTWNVGLDQLPYTREVRANFHKFRDEAMKIKVADRMVELDGKSFSEFTSGYVPEIQQWWDGYGPSNWGARVNDTSAWVGLGAMQSLVTGDDAQRVILPGGLGSITHKLGELLQPQYKDRMIGNATVVAVVPEKDFVQVTYILDGKVTTVETKAVLMCTAKYITSRLVGGLPPEQKAAMQHTRYAPYPVVNVIFDKPVYNRGYDTWCPGNSFTDFIVADWTVRDRPGYVQKNNILTFYTPLQEDKRQTLLSEEGCKSLAARVLADFQKLMPEFNSNPVEVRIYRRGHPMFMATPGQYTRNRVAAAHPMDRIFFGNADSGGPESLTSESIRLSQAGAEWARLVLAQKPGARDLAEKALAVLS
jgi:monoamine oxidase